MLQVLAQFIFSNAQQWNEHIAVKSLRMFYEPRAVVAATVKSKHAGLES